MGSELPDVELPKSSGALPSGNVPAIGRQWIVCTKFDHVICIRGRG